MRQSPNKAVRVLGHILYRLWRISAEGIALILGLGCLWLYGANYLTAQKEVDISFLSSNVSTWFASAFEGRSGDIDSIFLKWEPIRHEVVLTANNARIRDQDDQEIQFINKISSSLDFTQALSGRFAPQVIEIDGGSVTWVKTADGVITAGLGTPETVGKFGVFIHQKLNDIPQSRRFSMGELQGVRVKNSTIYIMNEISEVDFHVDEASLELMAQDNDYVLNAAGNLIGQAKAGRFDLKSKFNDDFSDFTLELDTQDLRLSEIAPKIGRFHELSDFHMPLKAWALVRAVPDKGLDNVQLDLTAGAGAYSIFNIQDELKSANFKAKYDNTLREIVFETVNIDSGKIRAQGTAGFSNVGTPETALRSPKIDMDMNLSKFYIDLTDYFDAPFEYDEIKSKAAWIGEDKRLSIETYEFTRGLYSLAGDLDFKFSSSGKILNLSGHLNKQGEFTTDDFLTYWPTDFVMGARRWIFKAMKSGKFTDLRAQFDLDEAALSGEPFRDDQLSVEFVVEDPNVKYMDHMPIYLGEIARGKLQGNHLDVSANGGTVGTMSVQDGVVNIPVLRPKGGDFSINVNGSGDVAEMLRIIDNKPFEYTSRYGVKAEDFEGSGTVNLKITRPLLEFFELDRIQYNVTGNFEGASAPFSMGEYALKNGNVALKSDKTGMEISGPVDFGPWRPTLTIQETFTEPRPPSEYTIEGVLDRAVLDKFGIGFRQYFDGDIDLKIDATGQGVNVGSATFEADLTNSHIQLAQYNKIAGQAASLTGIIDRENPANGIVFNELNLTGPGLVVNGAVNIAADGRLNYLTLTNSFIEAVSDVKIDVRPDQTSSRLMVDLSGKYLDISDFTSQMIRPDAEPLGVPYALNANLETLVVKPDFILTNTAAKVVNNGEKILEADVKGKAYGKDFFFVISPEDNARRMTVEFPDAGKAIYAFSKSTRLTGGTLRVDGQMLPLEEGGGFVGDIRMDDFVVQEAPAFAQLLSFASLRGLFDTLSGSGVHFEKLRMPIEYRRGRLKMTKARTSGSALGMTADGIINIADKTLDIDGVLVPSYTANSFLGGVPIIGDILVGKKGEGIFALSYTMKGPFEKTEVSVNPLSALTPGFLRGIFEPNRKKDDEIMEDAAQELADEIEKAKEGYTGKDPVEPLPEGAESMPGE